MMHTKTSQDPESTTTSTQTSTIVYEQPLNEATRLFLKIEHLLAQFDKALQPPHSPNAIRYALETLLRLATLTDRPDLKSKLINTLGQQHQVLTPLRPLPSVKINQERLQHVLSELHRLTRRLHDQSQTRLGETLREQPFLKNIRLQLTSPAGPCDFKLPAYALWLQQSHTTQLNALRAWASSLDALREAVFFTLTLTRDSSPSQPITTNNRFYQQSLDPHLPCHLIRITLPLHHALYPEFSVGRHRFSFRLKPLTPEAASPDSSLLSFELQCCTL